MPPSSRDLDDALLTALERADREAAAQALEAGADPNAERGGGRHALVIALDADMIYSDSGGRRATSGELMELLFEAGADRTRIHHSLQWSVELGRVDLVRRFLAESIEEDRKLMLPALCRAADRGREDILDALFESGLRPAAEPSGSPVAEALEQGRDGVFRRFVDQRLWLDTKDILGRRPLHVAALNGKVEALRALLDAAATTDADASFRIPPSPGSRIEHTYEESTALHVAVRSGHLEIAEALLDAGADFDRRDGLGRTALDWARQLGNEEIAQALHRHGAREALPPADLRVAFAAENGDSAALAAALESGGAADIRDPRKPTRGMTPLMLAARAGHADCIRILLDAGASLELHDDPKRSSHGAWMAFDCDETSESLRGYGICPKRTALHYAAEAGQAESIDLLLAAGAKPSPKDFRGLAPLHLAVWAGHLESVRRLLAAKARVIVTDFDKQTPLHLAAVTGNELIARELLAVGAQPERPDQDRKTPLELAEESGNRALIELLRHPPPRTKR